MKSYEYEKLKILQRNINSKIQNSTFISGNFPKSVIHKQGSDCRFLLVVVVLLYGFLSDNKRNKSELNLNCL